MIVVIDNYDSFTYNLVQFIGELGADPTVFRNDATTPEKVRKLQPRGIIISPGPCTPQEAGISVELVQKLSGEIPILGVCLGHQSIGAAFGGTVARVVPIHGKASLVYHDGNDLFEGVDSPLSVGRYHSLVVDADLPGGIEATARTEDGLVMAIRHREHPTFGLQFHPESILTPSGKGLLKTFLQLCGEIGSE